MAKPLPANVNAISPYYPSCAQQAPYGTLKARTTRTTAIVDARGHLLPGMKKAGGAFNPELKPYAFTKPRWPQVWYLAGLPPRMCALRLELTSSMCKQQNK